MSADPWEPTRNFFDALAKLREEEAKNGPVKLYTLRNSPRHEGALPAVPSASTDTAAHDLGSALRKEHGDAREGQR